MGNRNPQFQSANQVRIPLVFLSLSGCRFAVSLAGALVRRDCPAAIRSFCTLYWTNQETTFHQFKTTEPSLPRKASRFTCASFIPCTSNWRGQPISSTFRLNAPLTSHNRPAWTAIPRDEKRQSLTVSHTPLKPRVWRALDSAPAVLWAVALRP